MPARYEDEISNLKVSRVLIQFPGGCYHVYLSVFLYVHST